jgi:hypothetical protein
MPEPPASVAARRRGALLPRRFLAALCDSILVVLLGLLLWSSLGQWAATRATQLLRIGQPETFWHGPIPLLLGVIGNLTYALPVLSLIILLPEAVGGSGAGKLATRLRIVGLDPAGGHSLQKRYAVKCAPCLVWLGALSIGQTWTLWVLGAAVTMACLGMLPVLGGRPTLHDRLARTQVRANDAHRM